MRPLSQLNKFRDTSAYASRALGSMAAPQFYDICGVFRVQSPVTTDKLLIIASVEDMWDHVSISLPKRCPNWPEMSHIKTLFFEDTELALQLHVPKNEWVNNHRYCLHLWGTRHIIPLPPRELVGLQEYTPEQVDKMSDRQKLALKDEGARRLVAKGY